LISLTLEANVSKLVKNRVLAQTAWCTSGKYVFGSCKNNAAIFMTFQISRVHPTDCTCCVAQDRDNLKISVKIFVLSANIDVIQNAVEKGLLPLFYQ